MVGAAVLSQHIFALLACSCFSWFCVFFKSRSHSQVQVSNLGLHMGARVGHIGSYMGFQCISKRVLLCKHKESLASPAYTAANRRMVERVVFQRLFRKRKCCKKKISINVVARNDCSRVWQRPNRHLWETSYFANLNQSYWKKRYFGHLIV